MDTLRPLVDEKPVVIFSKNSTDPVSHSMKHLFISYGANPIVYELNELSNRQEVENALGTMGHVPSVPAIFIGGNFIGGANDVISLQVRGELAQRLIDARAIWVWNGDR
uniref:Glutaredoxin domain-containing protein n=1 Tax=Chenopodium quinoa TaxID=63459 RepID=A0A803MSU1_CHEQI